jgi:PAS domain S-box-containing protein
VKSTDIETLEGRESRRSRLSRERDSLLERLRESEAQVEVARADARLLQELSGRLIREQDVAELYDAILATAVTIMDSECASLQLLYTEEGGGPELRLLAHRGFDSGAAKFWAQIRPGASSSCGQALVTERRMIVPDVCECEFMTGSEDLAQCLRAGIAAMQSTPLKSRSGQLLGMISTHWHGRHTPGERELGLMDVVARQAADLIERARAEEALRAKEERLRLTFTAANIGAWELDLERMTAPVHSQQHDRIFGYETQPEHWSFDSLLSHVHPEDRDMVVRSFDEALRTRSWSCDCRIVRTDGRERWITIQGAFYDDGDDRPARAIGIVKDVTQRKETEEALREADRRKDEFLATLAHELRNPLAPIRSGLELMRMLGDEREVINDTLRRMETQTGHLVRLVDDLLDLSRVTSGKVTLRKEPLELRQVVQGAVEAARPELADAGHRMHVSLPDEPLYVDADPTRLSQILSNLITNAGKYSRPAGKIRLSAEHKDGDVAISVRDDGIGIPAAMLDRIFDMFVQGEYSGGGMQGGLGIGLTLVKRLVDMHGGSIRAYSEGPGRGSEFEVRLPAAVPSAAHREERAAATPPHRCLKVLVADDNEDAVLLLSAVVEMLGHEVCAATDGRQAVELARDLKPDLVLMDLGMPRLDGLEAARRIRQEPWGHKPVLVAITGWGQGDDVRRTQEAGFNLHVTKPVEAQALRELLSNDQLFGSS